MTRKCGSAGWKNDAKLCKQSPGGVDPRGARGHPGRADPMQGGQLLLALSLDRHGMDVAIARGFEYPFDIGAVGLRPLDVRAHRTGWKQFHVMPEAFKLPSPIMRRAAGLHDNRGGRLSRHKPTQLRARQSMVPGNMTWAIRDANFENGFC